MTQVKENSANTVKTMQTFSTVADGFVKVDNNKREAMQYYRIHVTGVISR